jgi:hypothetical protein
MGENGMISKKKCPPWAMNKVKIIKIKLRLYYKLKNNNKLGLNSTGRHCKVSIAN